MTQYQKLVIDILMFIALRVTGDPFFGSTDDDKIKRFRDRRDSLKGEI